MLIAFPLWGISPDEPERVRELSRLLEAGEYDEAWELGNRLRAELEGEEPASLALARTLFHLTANAFEGRHEGEGASFELARRALDLHEELLGSTHPWTLRSRERLANVMQRRGRYAEAEEELRRTLELAGRSSNDTTQIIASVRHNLGNALQRMGRFTASREEYEKALAAYPPDARGDRASTLVALGALLFSLQDYEDARGTLEEAEALWSAELGADHPSLAVVHHDLANALAALGDAGEARRHFERALALGRTGLGENHPAVAAIWSDFGLFERQDGHPSEARRCFEEALRALETSGGATRIAWAYTAGNLADAERTDGRPERALSLYRAALEALGDSVPQTHPEIGSLLVRLAHLELDSGRRRRALELAVRASHLGYRRMRDTLGGLAERQAILAMEPEGAGPETVLIRGVLSARGDLGVWTEALWSWTLAFRALALDEVAGRYYAPRVEEGPAIGLVWRQLGVARGRLAEAWNRGPDPGGLEAFEAELAVLRERKEEAEARLARLRGRLAPRAEPPTLEELRQALPAGDVVVEIVRGRTDWRPGDTRDLALFVRADRSVGVIDLGPSAEIDRRVEDWRAALDGTAVAALAGRLDPEAREAIARTARAVRVALWEPVRRALGASVQRLFLVPQGALQSVDLAALPTAEGAFLLEHGPVLHLLGSARDLVRREPSGLSKGSGALVVGGPDFDGEPAPPAAGVATPRGRFRGSSRACAPRSGHWEPLPESVGEAVAVEALLGEHEPILLLSGSQASEEAVKRNAPGRRLLHLATHGFFSSPDCGSRPGIDSPSPLLHSGLVLAGANRDVDSSAAGEDGILTAEEIAGLPLDGVELAVLSGCDTGLGVHGGREGVLGLRRALDVAGTGTVVMSLWRVPDRRARQLVTELYRNLVAGMATPEALHRSKLALLGRLREEGVWPHPYLWAGYVSAGDWR